MCMYVITNSKGSYIGKDGSKYVPIKSFKKAIQWAELSKANNVLSHGLNNKLRGEYNVVAIEDSSNRDIVNTIDVAIEDNNIGYWENRLQDVFSLTNDAQNRFVELNDALSTVDKKITDVQHYIEFNNLNASEGWKCFNLLQSLLRERRTIKDERETLKKILDYGFNKKNIEQLCKELKTTKEKIYTPRALPELFSAKDVMSITV